VTDSPTAVPIPELFAGDPSRITGASIATDTNWAAALPAGFSCVFERSLPPEGTCPPSEEVPPVPPGMGTRRCSPQSAAWRSPGGRGRRQARRALVGQRQQRQVFGGRRPKASKEGNRA
jgi:hypothetical protein